jgi:plasmid replication initiation protein
MQTVTNVERYVTPGAETKIRQNNDFIDGRYNMDVVEKRIMYLLILQMNYGQKDLFGNATFNIRIKDIAAGNESFNNYTYVRKVCNKLQRKIINIKDDKLRGVYTDVQLLGEVTYRPNQGIINVFVFEKVIKKYFNDFSGGNFTEIQIMKALSLETVHGQRFYELCNRFKDTGYWTISLDKLKHSLALDGTNPETGNPYYVDYSMFKNKVLVVAQRELESKTELSFTFREIRDGRTVVRLEFNIVDRDKKVALPPFEWPVIDGKELNDEQKGVVAHNVKLLTEMGLKINQAQALSIKALTDTDVAEKIEKVITAVQQRKKTKGKTGTLDDIKNRGAYLVACLDAELNTNLKHHVTW